MTRATDIVVVAGLARSGLTLTMQMLHAGGYSCQGAYPDFEPYGFGEIPWTRIGPSAVKLVDAHLHLPNVTLPGARVICPRRDKREQARSQKKLMAAMGLPAKRIREKDLIKGYRDDYKIIGRWASTYETLYIQFEDMILKPVDTAERVAEFVGGELDTAAMADTVIDRTPDCHDRLLELEMLESGYAP